MDNAFTVAGGVKVSVSESPVPIDAALAPVFAAISTRKGAVFSSGFDYPGRHSRWDIGFSDPAVEFVARKKNFVFAALNPKGEALLTLFQQALKGHAHLRSLELDGRELRGTVTSAALTFTEEERSRQPSVFSVLRSLVTYLKSDAPEASHFGLYGAFGYDLVMEFEPLRLSLARDQDDADCRLYLPLELTVIDRKRETASRITYEVETPLGSTAQLQGGGGEYEPPAATGSTEITCDHGPGEFADKVRHVIEGTERGDYFEVVLSQSFSTRFEGKVTDLFHRLAHINPSPYMFLLNFGEEQLVGASPEIYARVSGRRYETCPIAGTVARGASALEDADRVRELIGSRKDESELTMCTDVDRNDMARVCVPGTVQVIGRRQLEFYSHLIHTVDHLQGTLREDADSLDAFQTHMWACTVTGAPKPAALQTIEALEKSPRGWYSGAIGMLCFNGDLNTGITLRTAHLKDGRATVRAGATLLYGSDPEQEELETRTKAAAFLAALAHERSSAAVPKEKPGKKDQSNEHPTIPLQSSGRARKVLLVDCRDSFVHNLAAYLRELGAEVVTLRAGFDNSLLDEIGPGLVVLSPGPGTPEEFGIPTLVGELVRRRLGIFGVCLGHQGIGQHFGATLSQLPVPEHGKPSVIRHNGNDLFREVPNPFEAGRYHSLYLLNDTVPECLDVCAVTTRTGSDGKEEILPMAFRHRTLPIASVQFHPESLMTLKQRSGHLILRNALLSLA